MSDCVLVVEDDRDVRESLIMVLESEGYRAVGADNGRAALERLGEPPRICVILLDLLMPVMDGWEFREAQERDPAIADIPVIVVSAVTLTAPRLPRADAYANKPVAFGQLIELVERYCRRA